MSVEPSAVPGLLLATLGPLFVLAAAAYLARTLAIRVKRLDERCEHARAQLGAELGARCIATIAASQLLEPPESRRLVNAAAACLAIDLPPKLYAEDERGRRRELAESRLTRRLRDILSEHSKSADDRDFARAIDRVRHANRRVRLARALYNQATIQDNRLREKRVVRLFHLSGRSRTPRTFDIDDDLEQTSRQAPGRSG